jgi:uncharacterized protein with PhoU and TrkA domain
VTDIVKQLREGALSGDLPLGVAFNWSEVADEIERLQEQVALLRHAATIEAASLAEQAERADRLQALIDAWADTRWWAKTLGADGPEGALLAAATKENEQ